MAVDMTPLTFVLVAAAVYLVVVAVARLRGRSLSTRAMSLLALIAAGAVVLGIVLAPSGADGQSPWRWIVLPKDTAAIDAAVAALHPPPGFTRNSRRCQFAQTTDVEDLCFTRRRSLVLSDAEMARVVAGTGARNTSLGLGVQCLGLAGAAARPAVRRLGLRPEACEDAATSGTILLLFAVNSVVRVNPTSVVSATHSVGPFPGGTQINIAVDYIRR